MNWFTQTLLPFINKRLTALIVTVMLAGLLNATFFGGMRFSLLVCALASFLMIYPMFINLRIEDVREVRNYKKPVLISIFLNFIFSPLIGLLLGRIFFQNQPNMALGLLLISLIPTSGMTATWTERTKGDLKAALAIISVSLLIVVIALPTILPLVAGEALVVTPFFIFKRILMVIVVPLILGDITRRILIAKRGMDVYKKSKPIFSGLSSLGLLIVLFLIMSLSTNRLLLREPLLTLHGFIPLVIYYGAMFTASTLLTRSMNHAVAVAVTYGTSVRYLALALGIAVPLLGVGPESGRVVFIIALAFFVQVPFSSIYSAWRITKT